MTSFLWYMKFSQRCCWRFKSSSFLHQVDQ